VLGRQGTGECLVYGKLPRTCDLDLPDRRPGGPTDITVSRDKKWLAVIYGTGGGGYVAVFAIDAYGDLTPAATSSAIGIAGFSGVAISE
jgi:hypothetical protein